MANDILVKVGADISDFSRKMQESSKALGRFMDANNKTFDSFSKTGKAVTGMGIAVSGGLGFAVKKAAGFESAMSSVAAVSGATGKDFDLLSAKAREMGASTSFSATDAANGLEYMALAGWDTNQMLSGIEPVLHLAEAGALDLGRASDLVTDSMSALGVEVGDLDGYLDKVAQTSRKSNTDIDALMEALIVAGGKFRELNVPLEESNAMLGVLANRGFKGSEAGTAMNAILTRLTATTGPSAEALADLGISAFDSEGNFRGLEAVMKDVESALSEMDDEQRSHYQTQIAGLNHGKAFSAMLDGMSGEYDDLKGSIKDSDGALQEMRDTMKDNLQGALENLSSAFEEMMISIGSALLPVVKDLTAWLQKAADWFNNLDDSTKENIAKFTALAGAIMLVVGPLMMVIGFIPNIVSGFMHVIRVVKLVGKAIALLTSPVGIAIAAVAGLAFLVYKYWDEIKAFTIESWNAIKEFFSELWESIKEIFTAVWEPIKEAWSTAVEWLQELWNGIGEFFSELWQGVTEVFTSFVDGMKEIFSPITEFFSEILGTVSEVFTENWNVLTEFLSETWENITTIASAAWELIKNVILGPILLLINLITGDMEEFSANLEAIWGNIKEAAGRIWGALKDQVSKLMESLGEILSNIWDGMKRVASIAWEGMKSAASKIWNGIKSLGSTIWNGIKETVSDLANKAKEGAIKAWDTLKEKTSEAFNKVVDFIKDPLENIDLFSIGKDIIQGLINGIGSMATAVWDKAKDIGRGITDGIKGVLGIKSPSRVMMRAGKDTGAGLVKGLNNSRKSVSKASKTLSSDVIKNLNVKFDTKKLNATAYINELKKIRKEYRLTAAQKRMVDKGIYKGNQSLKKQAQDLRKSLNKINSGVKTSNNKFLQNVRKINANLKKDIAKAKADFKKQVADTAKSIYGQIGLFDDVENKEVDGNKLLENLRKQNEQFSKWQSNLAKISRMKAPKAFVQELREMGVGSAAEIQAIANMSKKQLNAYVKAWREKHRLANAEAKKQTESEKKALEKQIKALNAAAKKEIAKAKTEWRRDLSKLGTEVSKLGTFRNSGKVLGKDTARGLIRGLRSMRGGVAKEANKMARTITSTIKKTLKIKSPSRVMMSLGKWTSLGLAEGIEDYAKYVDKASDRLAESAVPDVRSVDMSYNTPAGVRNTLSSAVQGTVDIDTRDDRLVRAIGTLERRLTNLEVVMDGRSVGKIVEPHVTELQDINKRRSGRWR